MAEGCFTITTFEEMVKAQLFNSIEALKAPEPRRLLSEQEALERALDLLDFYAQLRHASGLPSPENYPDIQWIELKFRDDTK